MLINDTILLLLLLYMCCAAILHLTWAHSIWNHIFQHPSSNLIQHHLISYSRKYLIACDFMNWLDTRFISSKMKGRKYVNKIFEEKSFIFVLVKQEVLRTFHSQDAFVNPASDSIHHHCEQFLQLSILHQTHCKWLVTSLTF